MRYVVVEGLDYSGKTYFINEISKMFSKTLKISEPFNQTKFCSKIRDIIRSDIPNKEREKELLLKNREIGFSILEYQIEEYLKENIELDLLVSDRNFLTTLVYQCETKEEMKDVINNTISTLDSLFINVIPDIVYYLEIPFELALERSNKRGIENNLDKKVLVKDVYEKMQSKYRLALEVLKDICPNTEIFIIEGVIDNKKLSEIRCNLYTDMIINTKLI